MRKAAFCHQLSAFSQIQWLEAATAGVDKKRARACFIDGFVKGHDFSRAEKGRRIEGF